jgi:hypothetical protein
MIHSQRSRAWYVQNTKGRRIHSCLHAACLCLHSALMTARCLPACTARTASHVIQVAM